MVAFPWQGWCQTRLLEALLAKLHTKIVIVDGPVLVASLMFLVRLTTKRSGCMQGAYGAWNGGEEAMVQRVWVYLLHTVFCMS